MHLGKYGCRRFIFHFPCCTHNNSWKGFLIQLENPSLQRRKEYYNRLFDSFPLFPFVPIFFWLQSSICSSVYLHCDFRLVPDQKCQTRFYSIDTFEIARFQSRQPFYLKTKSKDLNYLGIRLISRSGTVFVVVPPGHQLSNKLCIQFGPYKTITFLP